MTDNKWNDDQLKSLLKQLPSIKDERDPQRIFTNVQREMKKRRERLWIMPSAASVLVVLIVFIIGNSMSDNSLWNVNDNESSTVEDRNYTALDNSNQENAIQEEKSTKDRSLSLNRMSLEKNAVYQEDIQNKDIFTYPIPDINVQVVVPISIIVDKENDDTRFDRYKENMNKLKENQWNLQDYYPYQGNISYDSTSQTITVNAEDDLTGVGASSDGFFHTLVNQQLESIGAKTMKFTKNGKMGLVVGERELTEIHYEPLDNRGYFLLNASLEENQPLYVPWESPYENIKKALVEMKKDKPQYGLSASIPEEIEFDQIIENNDRKLLTIQFANDSRLQENQATIRAIETILLTAKEFHFSAVKFENANLSNVGDFSFAEEVKVPVAANKRELNE